MDPTRPRRPPRRHGRATPIAAALLVVVLIGAACAAAATRTESAKLTSASRKPNIVFILTDDLSWNLITPQIAPHIVALEKAGETFDHYFVADSLCCPSRSTIFTGLFPHDTKVTTNSSPDGGYDKFQEQGLDHRTYAVALQSAGYATSMNGKYLNGYGDPDMSASTAPVPPGWTDWHVSNTTGYAEFNFTQNDNGTFNTYSGQRNYGVDVLNSKVQSFIKSERSTPFAVEVATYAPHLPYTPAPRNSHDFPGLTQPHDPSFNVQNVNPPAWMGQRPALGAQDVATTDAVYRRRAQSVEAVDKLLADTEATLAAKHLSGNTYIVFSSDNGYHLGQHRLEMGKQTAFDTDIRVPLIVAGPGVPQGQTVHDVVQNTDLYPTFVQLAGATVAGPVDGTSLVPLLHPTAGTSTAAWPTVALVEHQGPDDPTDPDYDGGSSDPTTYQAIRISAPRLPGFAGPVDAVYVEYADAQHELEYYDITNDQFEIVNIAGSLTATQKAELHQILVGLVNCHTAAACWNAALPM
jgi:N-acetylglucosamine-6-sulfatase